MKNILTALALANITALGFAQTTPASSQVSQPMVTAAVRERTNATQWFSATPNPEVYGYQDSLLRLSLSQHVHHFDYMVDLGQSAELALPTDAVSPIAAQGQLGLGGTYYASNNNNPDPVAASFRQGFLRYHFTESSAVRLGRFEFFDGQELSPKDASLQWLQNNRIAQRLVGNFGFSNGQRSFDGLDLKLGAANWDFTAMAGRAVQGVFNMNANPELNVDIQYLAYSRSFAAQHIIVRGFGLGYHDGRTGLIKTDNRSAAARALDHKNIRIGTYGGNLIAAAPVGKTTLDFVAWGAVQNGRWGLLGHSAGAIDAEGGIKLNKVASNPWLRGGYFRSTGDNNPNDDRHTTFFQVLPTPRVYARFPFFNQMNSTDEFVQLIDKPTRKLDLRTDLHFLQLTSNQDFWYQGGGAFDNKVFGYTGRPSNGHSSFSSLYDMSADYAITQQISVAAYYAHAFGKTVVGSIYNEDKNANYGYFELTYRFQKLI